MTVEGWCPMCTSRQAGDEMPGSAGSYYCMKCYESGGKRVWLDVVDVSEHPAEKVAEARSVVEPSVLASEHWFYIDGLLQAHGETPETIAKIHYHYTTAFIHGWKHRGEAK